MSCYDPTLDEMLADPIVQAVMQADAIDRSKIETLLSDVARERGPTDKTPAVGLWAVFCRTRPTSGRCLGR